MDIGIFSGFTPDKDSLVEVNRKNFSLFAELQFLCLAQRSNFRHARGDQFWPAARYFPRKILKESVRNNCCHAKYANKLKLVQNSVKEIKVGNRKGLDFRTQIFLS